VNNLSKMSLRDFIALTHDRWDSLTAAERAAWFDERDRRQRMLDDLRPPQNHEQRRTADEQLAGLSLPQLFARFAAIYREREDLEFRGIDGYANLLRDCRDDIYGECVRRQRMLDAAERFSAEVMYYEGALTKPHDANLIAYGLCKARHTYEAAKGER
jgi:hypothetical protein